jgi:pyruvate-formate lyase-activating enzyme
MSLIRIGGIERFSIVDFPNQMAAVVFMQGCPWLCPFCHNAHLQDVNAETNIVWYKFIDFLNIKLNEVHTNS